MKSPALHFVLLGLGLFMVTRLVLWDDSDAPTRDSRIVFSSEQVDGWVSQYEATAGIPATDEVKAELVERAAEDEMLVRESRRWGLASNNRAVDQRLRQIMAFVAEEELADDELARRARELGFDASDAVIRGMLAQNMRLLMSRDGERPPSDQEIEAYYERESARFARPVRMTGWHVFFSKDRTDAPPDVAARAAKKTISTGTRDIVAAVALGDVSPSGPRFQGQLAHQLASRFGQGFAAVAESIPAGEWSDPVESPFGAHLVLVEVRTQQEAPPLATIRSRVEAAYQSNRRQARLAVALEELHARYEVVIQ